jgi:hypothetical protein
MSLSFGQTVNCFEVTSCIETWLIDCLLFYVPLKNISLIWRRHHYWWRAYARRSGPLSRERSLSCHTCCDTGPRSFWKNRHIQSPFTTHKRMWRIYSNPDPHGLKHLDGYCMQFILELTGKYGAKEYILWLIYIIYLHVNIIFSGRHVYLGFLFWSAEETLPMCSFRLVLYILDVRCI